jgi:hypothetical protein
LSSNFLPYNLRTNKAVDRSIFMEFLMKLNANKPISEYSYIGFGATHMEDHKLIHSLFGIENLISIESDNSIYRRQQFNKPINCIDIRNCKSGEFIEEYDFEDNVIIWLDYVTPKNISEQIREFQSVIEKCSGYDVIKITVNCNPNALGKLDSQNRTEDLENRLNKLKDRINPFLNEETTPEDMTLKKLPEVLVGALVNASLQITKSSHFGFCPITAFTYSDGPHQMLTFTGIILEKESDFLEKVSLKDWKYYYGLDKKIFKINLPDLTLRERLLIDAMLPCEDNREIIEALNYNEILTFEKEIENYINYYRHFPNFSKVVI